MTKLVQIRDVPEEVHRTLKARAAQRGNSLSEYLRAELQRLALRPTGEEIRARLHSRSVVDVDEPPSEVIRRRRDAAA